MGKQNDFFSTTTRNVNVTIKEAVERHLQHAKAIYEEEDCSRDAIPRLSISCEISEEEATIIRTKFLNTVSTEIIDSGNQYKAVWFFCGANFVIKMDFRTMTWLKSEPSIHDYCQRPWYFAVSLENNTLDIITVIDFDECTKSDLGDCLLTIASKVNLQINNALQNYLLTRGSTESLIPQFTVNCEISEEEANLIETKFLNATFAEIVDDNERYEALWVRHKTNFIVIMNVRDKGNMPDIDMELWCLTVTFDNNILNIVAACNAKRMYFGNIA